MRQDAEEQLSAHHQRKIKFTTFREMKYNLPLNKWNHNICNIQKKMSTKMMMMAIRKMQKEGEQNWIRPIVHNNFLHVAYIPFLGGQRRSGQRKKQQQKLWDSIFLDWICAQVAADDAMILLCIVQEWVSTSLSSSVVWAARNPLNNKKCPVSYFFFLCWRHCLY